MTQTSPLDTSSVGLTVAAIDDKPASVLVARSEASVPANPAELLIAHGKAGERKRRPWLLYAGGALFVCQLIAPADLKPAALAGGIVASFTAPTLQAYTNNTIVLAQQQALAQRISELEADRASWNGKCALAGLLGPDAGRACLSIAETHYQNALAEARRSLSGR